MEGILDVNAHFFSNSLFGMTLWVLMTIFITFLFKKAFEVLRRPGEKLRFRIIKFVLILIPIGIWIGYSIFIFCVHEKEELTEKITMPDMRGQNKNDAISHLEEKGINVEIDTEYSDDYSKDLIMKQSQWPNENLTKGDTITLTISLGTEPIKLMDYVSHTISDIENEVKEIGLSVNVKEQYSSVAKKGIIIKQSPKANETVYKGNVITFYVSKGVEQVRVPVLYGMTKTKAKKKLKRDGFKVKIKYEYNKMDKGKVFFQNIDADSIVKKGTLITIYISSGLKLSNYENKNHNNNNENKKMESKKTSSSNKKDKNIVDDSRANVVN